MVILCAVKSSHRHVYACNIFFVEIIKQCELNTIIILSENYSMLGIVRKELHYIIRH